MSQSSPVTRPRGPLPARVYWFRRGLVLGLASLLVLGLVLLVGSFGGGSSGSGGDQAVTAAAPASPSATASPTTSASPSASAAPSATTSTAPRAGQQGGKKAKQQLSTASGPCKASDVTVTGAPKQVVGGSAVTIPLVLTTSGQPCTLAVSPQSVVAKITSGKDRIWSSQDCPAAIPTSSVTVRPQDEPATTVNLTWSGRRSEKGCGQGTAWARPGSYHVLAATYGGAQSDQQFALGTPPRPVVTKTAKPKKAKPSVTNTPKG